MKKTNFPIHFSTALLLGAVIIGASIVYVFGGDQVALVNNDSSASVVDDAGAEYVVEEEEPLKVTVINDENCSNCDTEKLKALLKKQTGASLAIRELDFASAEAKNLISQNNAKFLPYMLLGPEMAQHPNITHLTHHVISKTASGYYLDLVKLGQPVGRYLDVAYYTADDPQAPKLTAAVTEHDFGTVRLSEGKVSKEFVVKNEGKSPLEFVSANSSCGCTSLRIALPGNTSPLYMMAGHQDSVEWKGSLAPGEEAKVIVYYDPAVHPELNKAVTRTVTVDTNDPNMPQLKLTIRVNQIAD